MKIIFAEEYKSLKSSAQFENCTIPDFTVLTGLNGSGKSHILEALKDGHLTCETIQPQSITLLSFNDMLGQQANAAGVQKQCEEFLDHQITANETWRRRIRNIYDTHLVHRDAETHHLLLDKIDENTPVWAIKKSQVTSSLWERIDNFKQALEKEIFDASEFKDFPHHEHIRQSYVLNGTVTRKAGFHYAKFIDVLGAMTLSAFTQLFKEHEKSRSTYVEEQFQSDQLGKKSDFEKAFDEKTPKPWDEINVLIADLSEENSGEPMFDFQLTHPGSASWSQRDTARIINKTTDAEIDFNELSSGEQVIFSFILMVFSERQGQISPPLLLLDEIDATLHPSMILVMKGIIESVFSSKGTKVIWATHSPTTIALNDEAAIHVVNGGTQGQKIMKVSKAKALEVLTEGYVTLDQGTKLLHKIADKSICILSEGHNAGILKHLLELHEIDDVEVIEDIDSKSGVTDLKMYGEFLKVVQHPCSALIVWDCDAADSSAYRNFIEGNNTYKFVIPHNPANELAKKGIENAFPEAAFLDEFLRIIENGERRFDGNKKREFARHAITLGLESYRHFTPLIGKLTNILNERDALAD